MKRLITLLALILAAAIAWAQTTTIDATRLLKPGASSTFYLTNGSGNVATGNLATIVSGGTGISVSGNTITNTAPDQTVTFAGGGGITGSYPSFTVDAELVGLAGLSGTGILVQTGAGAFAQRSIAIGTSDAGMSLGIGNADGTGGNPTLSISTGKYAWKQSARVVATSNITLSGNQILDGVTTATDDRVLVIGQSTASANGLYLAATGAWTRTTDFDGSTEMPNGALIFVEEGTAQGESVWALTTDGSITVGTTSLTFKRIGRANQVTAGSYGSATAVPVITLNDDGTISGVTNTSITYPALSAGDGSGSDRTIILGSPGSGTVTLAQGSGITLTRSSNTITIAAAASAPTITIQRYEEISSGGQTEVTVSGFTPLTTDTMVFVDGVHMDWGAGEDITLSGSVITFLTALVANQKIIVKKITAS